MPSGKKQKSFTSPKRKATSKLSVKNPKSGKGPTRSKASRSTSTLNTNPIPPDLITFPPQEVWELAFTSFIPDSVTRLRHLNTKALEGAGKYGPYKPYYAMVGYQGNVDEPTECKVAVLALYPGITLGQAQRAAELLVEKLPISKTKGGQTPYNLELRMTIRYHILKITQDESYITRLFPPGEKLRMLPKNKSRRGAEICRAIAGHLEVSETFVQKCYRKWLDEQGLPKKTYHRE